MLTIAGLGAGGRSPDYYLDRGAGCEEEPDRQRSGADVDYYGGDDSTPGRWLGGGAAAVGLTGALDEAGGQVLRNLLDRTRAWWGSVGPAGDACGPAGPAACAALGAGG